MISQLLRFGALIHRIKRKALVTANPGLKLENAFQSGLGRILGGERLVCVDIGGAVDLQPHWYRLVENSELHIFEPHPESRREIESKYAAHPRAADFHVHPEALSGSGGRRTLFLTNCPTGSTIVPLNFSSAYIDRNDPYLFPLTELPLETLTLENALAAHGVSRIDLIKLDIQGAELEVLRSAGSHLQHLLGFELEVSLNDTFQGGTTLRELAAFAEEQGFELFDVKVARAYVQRKGMSRELQEEFSVNDWNPAVSAKAWEFDVVAFRRPDELLARRDAPSLRRLMASYAAYGFLLEAAGLTHEMREAGLLGELEERDIRESLHKLKKAISLEVGYFRKVAAGLGNRVWGQYMWLHFPTS